MHRFVALCLGLTVASSTSGSLSGQPLPLGSTTLVNSVLDDAALAARIGASDGDAFRIVWQQHYASTDMDVRSRRLQANGNFGTESTLNVFTSGRQGNPDVAMNGSSDWASCWLDDEQGVTGTHVYVRRTSADGTLLSGEVAIDDHLSTLDAGPAEIDVADNDDMVVAWRDSDNTIWFERLTDAGVGFGEFVVGTHAAFHPQLSVAALGNVQSVVAWADFDSGGLGIFARCVSSVAPAAPAFQVNVGTAGAQEWPVIAAADDGRFAVLWYTSAVPASLRVRIFSSDCTPLTGDIEVDDSPTNPDFHGRIGMADDGAFVVAWDIAGAGNDIYAREFTKSGAPVGSAFSVLGAAFGSPSFPDVAVGPTTYAVVWNAPDFGLDDSHDVLVRRFARRVVFTDDFETADDSAWSEVVP